MAEIKLQKTVFNKPEFDNVIDRDFKFFTPPEDLEDNDTVLELFRLYNKLYFEIPLRNTNTSHEFLIRKSMELVDFDEDNERLQPLLDEISNLRAQLVDNQAHILELQLQNLTDTNG